MHERMHDVQEGVQHAPQMVKARTKGSPLTAGLVAFGTGLVVAAALPPSRAETRAAERMEDQLEPVKDEVARIGSEVVEEIKASGSEAVTSLEERAGQARQSVMEASPAPGEAR